MTAHIAATGSDRRMAVVAGLAVGVSVIVVVVRALGLLPSSAAAGIVLICVVIGLRVALMFASRAGSSPRRARIMMIMSTVGLAISAVTVLASLPHVTKLGGTGKFVGDLFAHLWTLALLTAAAGPVRTLGWRAFAGVGMVGFLALPSLARLVGTPVVHKLGTSSLLATALYAPVTEELIKALPVLLILVLAVRRTAMRPAALDVMLLGAWAGTGFALYEDATYGRGGFDWSADAPLSALVPSELKDGPVIAGGHLVYTALIALGSAVTVLYLRRFRWAWLAAPVAVLVVIGEHIAVNSVPLLTPAGKEPVVERILAPLTLGGRLSTLLLVAGVVAAVIVERRAIRPGSRPIAWLQLRPAESGRRLQLLAMFQHAFVPSGEHR